MLEVSVGTIVPVAMLDTIGLVLNGWLLYIIKARTPIFNAIDVIQVIKIVMVISALLITVWLEFIPCTQQTSVLSTKICIEAQELTNDCFFHSICWTLVTVALVRKKVCECRGRASVLVTRRYGLKTLALCLTPVCVLMAISGSIMFQAEPPRPEIIATSMNTSTTTSMGSQVAALSTRSSMVFTLCHSCILGVIPLVLLCGLYMKISGIVRQTAQAANDLVQIRNRDPFKNILRSLVVHLTLSCSLWTGYLCLRIVTVALGLDQYYLVFMKLIILIAHPFGEGLLQPSFKKPTDAIHQRIQAKTNRRILPSSNTSFSDFRTMNNYIDERSTMAGDWAKDRKPRRKVSTQSVGRSGSECDVVNVETAPRYSNAKPRKESREELRKALQVFGDGQTEYARIRRLSNTLRFSTTAYPNQDMYDSYSMIKHSPVLSNLRKQLVNNDVCEGYVSPETLVKNFESDDSSPNTPQRRWKRLVTTARTVRRFSKTRLRSRSSNLESCLEETESPQPWKPVVRHDSATSKDSPRYSIASEKDKTWYASQSKSFDDTKRNEQPEVGTCDSPLKQEVNKGTKRVNSKRTPRTRAMSCVNNEWLLQRQQDKAKTIKDKDTVENDVFIEASGSLESSADLIRSISYDAKIRLNFAGGECVPKRTARQSRQSRYSRYSRENVVVDAVDANATRKECIKKLLEMREYF